MFRHCCRTALNTVPSNVACWVKKDQEEAAHHRRSVGLHFTEDIDTCSQEVVYAYGPCSC